MRRSVPFNFRVFLTCVRARHTSCEEICSISHKKGKGLKLQALAQMLTAIALSHKRLGNVQFFGGLFGLSYAPISVTEVIGYPESILSGMDRLRL